MIKTYQQIVMYLADNMWHSYMGGSNNYRRDNLPTIVCLIYGVKPAVLERDVKEQVRLKYHRNI